MQDLSLHILDVAENSVSAGASFVDITVTEDAGADVLKIEIVDNGSGMAPEFTQNVLDPFVTTRTTRKVGLGLPLFAQAARRAGGDLTVESEPGVGTRVVATFEHGHVDRQPLGDLGATMMSLAVGYPGVDIRLRHWRDGALFEFDTREVRRSLGGVAINSADGIRALRKALGSA